MVIDQVIRLIVGLLRDPIKSGIFLIIAYNAAAALIKLLDSKHRLRLWVYDITDIIAGIGLLFWTAALYLNVLDIWLWHVVAYNACLWMIVALVALVYAAAAAAITKIVKLT